ncbi:MAG: hypothetical protein EXS36_13100 [Pedosphaera sp.]|nr:hypothetical protein [Pedosphaera sp.]
MMSSGSTQTGTHLYIAPELLAGRPATTRSDIYSLGVVLYQLLMGDFRRPLTTDWTRRIADPLLREDLEKCFAGDPEEQFANAGQFADSLRSLEKRLAELAARKRAADLRRLMRTAALAVILIAGLVGLVKYVVLHNRIPPATHFESLAVLPFSYSGDAGRESFADGMMDLLIGNLSKIRSLKKVSPRTSVFQYQGTKKSLRKISQELGVDAVLEGTVVLFGSQMSLSARLFEGATKQQLWASEPYTDDLTNIFKLQSKMALTLAQRINVKLLPQKQARLVKARSIDAEALHLYLEGSRHGLNHSDEIENKTAIQLLQRATAIDPDFAIAWAALALAYVDRVFYIAPGEK